MLRELCVERRGWIGAAEFEDAIAACNLLPGPASTQLAIFCAWRVRGRLGALVGGPRVHRPGADRDPRPGRAVPRRAPPRGCWAPGGRRRRGGRGRSARRGWAWCPPSWTRTRAGRSRLRWSRTCGRRRGVGRDARPVAGARAARLRRRRGGARRGARSRRTAPSSMLPLLAPRRSRPAALLALVLGGVQGRRAVLRRRLRDHPADAGRRRRPLPLDDRRRSSSTRSRSARSPPARSCRPSPSSATPPPGSRGGAARRGGRVRAVVRVRPARRPALRPAARATAAPGPSSTAPGRRPSARSSARRSRWPARSPSHGSTRCLPELRCCCLWLAGRWWRRSCSPPRLEWRWPPPAASSRREGVNNGARHRYSPLDSRGF